MDRKIEEEIGGGERISVDMELGKVSLGVELLLDKVFETMKNATEAEITEFIEGLSGYFNIISDATVLTSAFERKKI